MQPLLESEWTSRLDTPGREVVQGGIRLAMITGAHPYGLGDRAKRQRYHRATTLLYGCGDAQPACAGIRSQDRSPA